MKNICYFTLFMTLIFTLNGCVSEKTAEKHQILANQRTKSVPKLSYVREHAVKESAAIQPAPSKMAESKSGSWSWPAHGKVVEYYSPKKGPNKGINIKGDMGSPIYAAAAGQVIYSGNSLPGYGNLLIVRHSPKLLSAYAHNNKLLVHEGDWVKGGQKIAEMGNSGATESMLHFEIRQAGQPVNPLGFLTPAVG